MVKVADPENYDLEKVRKEWLGEKAPKQVGRYPVEHDPIRRHEHMTRGKNPMFLDPDWCKENSPYGAVVAPPVMVDYFAGAGAWPREGSFLEGRPLDVPTLGDRAINLNTEWEFIKPIKVGDHIWCQMEVADIFMKGIRLDPKAIWIINQTNYYNQDDELVAISRNTGLRHRSPEEVAADPDTEKLQKK